ncbi:MAG: hypothetical protein PQJ60_01780 [Spirochaetales bacterium]|nr:hypothetical protein [Spirochaetales bacterium]
MAQCTLCGEDTDYEYTWIKGRYRETVSAAREERVPLLGRNYRSDESPELRKVGEVRYYFDEETPLTGGLCKKCLEKKRKEDGWFRWPYLLFLILGLGGIFLGGDRSLVHLLSLFLLFMTLVGLVMRIARTVSHNDQIRVAEAMESYFLDEAKGGDGLTITKRDFLYRPGKDPERFVLFSGEEWDALGEDERGRFLV